MKRIVGILLVCSLLLSFFVPNALADSGFVEVIKSSAPVRDTYYETGTPIAWPQKGVILEYIDTHVNLYFHKWYKVDVDGEIGWIYEDNVKKHSHDYYMLEYEGNVFGVCEKCGTISVEKATTISYKLANSVAALPAAAGLAAADGPLPFGDICGLIVLGTTYAMIASKAPSTSIVYEVVNTLDLSTYADIERVCSVNSFYRVTRNNGSLQYVDKECMDSLQAFICVRFLGTDVWTLSQDAALECAQMNGSYFSERDKDRPEYWYHYHLGTDGNHKDSKAHIFYGTNDYGQVPQ